MIPLSVALLWVAGGVLLGFILGELEGTHRAYMRAKKIALESLDATLNTIFQGLHDLLGHEEFERVYKELEEYVRKAGEKLKESIK